MLHPLRRRRARVAEKPLARRAAEHRAARGAGQGAGRSPDRRPLPPAQPPRRLPALRRQREGPARDVPEHGRGRAQGGVRGARGGVAARQLPPGGLGDPRRPPEPAARLLPRAAQARHTRAGRRRPRLRDGRGADPAQRQPSGPATARALHEQLPDRRAADHRRAVGLAEHAEARPLREPPAPGGGGDRVARGAPRGRQLRRADRRLRARPAAAAATGGPSGLRRAAAAARARVRPAPVGGARGRGRPARGVGHGPGRGDPARAPAPGRVAGLRRERDHQPAPVLHSRLEPVLRVGEPGRGCPAARPGRRLRQHGLPEPRPLSRGGGGPGGRQRGESAPRGPAYGRERAPGRRGRPRRARHAHRPSPDRQGPRRTSKPTWPIGRVPSGACVVSSSRTRPWRISGRSVC